MMLCGPAKAVVSTTGRLSGGSSLLQPALLGCQRRLVTAAAGCASRHTIRARSGRDPQDQAKAAVMPDSLTITQPDDWHLHLRAGDAMRSAVPHTARVFKRAVIMPNLVPPVTTPALALAYRAAILDAVPSGLSFDPLMTCYLTDNTTPDDVAAAKDAGVVAFKLYPAGATTNSDSGVTDVARVAPAVQAMADLGLVLCVHGEVTDADVDIFDREREFIHRRLEPLLAAVPSARVVMEHITTRDAVEFVASAPANVAASITPQHMLHNRNALFSKGLRPHMWCLPILKREEHRIAVAAAATSGDASFFLGTDSAPHARGAKESACGCAGIFSAPAALSIYAAAFEEAGQLDRLEAFASINGPAFYRMPRNEGTVTLVRDPWTIPDSYEFGDSVVVPMWAGQTVQWRVQGVQ